MGGMVGIKANQQIYFNSQFIDNVKLSMQVAVFNIADKLSLYVGEYDIPYRLSSVRLSGKGMRYAGALNFGFGKKKWIAVKIAQTRPFVKDSDSADLELIVRASYIL